MHALLISTYELGRQPFGLASPAAWLRARGLGRVVRGHREAAARSAPPSSAPISSASICRCTRRRGWRGRSSRKVREINPSARLCAYGLYAPLNGDWLRSLGVDAVFGGEFEEELTDYATSAPRLRHAGPAGASVPRIHFLVPDRCGLPPLAQYATLDVGGGRQKIVGSTEASRGCKHLCRHCPVVPIYDGQFRIVPPEVVLADIDAQVAAGAEHITFGDPDFFNGPTHAMRVVDALHAAYPDVTYDVTIKVEHLLHHRDLLGRLAATGCAFVTSAVESIDDAVLRTLDKGHTRQDFVDAVAACRDANLTFVPTFVAFHPWLTLDGYCDLLDLIDQPRSRRSRRAHSAGHPAAHPGRLPAARAGRRAGARRPIRRGDAGVSLGRTPTPAWTICSAKSRGWSASALGVDRRAMFDEIAALAYDRGRHGSPRATVRRPERRLVPQLSEPWYCCAEPNPDHLTLV